MSKDQSEIKYDLEKKERIEAQTEYENEKALKEKQFREAYFGLPVLIDTYLRAMSDAESPS